MDTFVINQFIKFQTDIVSECDVALPVLFGRSSLSIYISATAGDLIVIDVNTIDGQNKASMFYTPTTNGWHSVSISQGISADKMASRFEDGDLFIIRLRNATLDYTLYSQPLQFRKSLDGLAVLTYSCNENAFELPFADAGEAIVTIPMVLTDPQYLQEDKVYTKSNGENVVLYAQYKKEWQAETDYLSERWHDNIIKVLSCDKIQIETGGIKQYVSKNGDYEIDWDNYDQLPDGTKTAKAAVKLQANINSRNSNY